MMKILLYIYLGLICVLLLNGCSSPTAIATPSQISVSEETSSYPGPIIETTIDPSYPGPATAVINIPGPTNIADPQMGSVLGFLLINGNPVKNSSLYLAEVITDSTGKDVVAGLDRANSPYAETDSEGFFKFINVVSGKYALILDVVTNQYMMNDPDSEDPIIIEISAGKEENLGNLNYDSLPLP